MYFIDPLRKLAFASQYGKQLLLQLRARPSLAMSPSEPVFESVRLPEMPSVAVHVPVPEIYEDQNQLSAYPGVLDYSQHEQLTLPEMSLSLPLRFEPVHPIPEVGPELSAATEISQAVELARHPDSVDGILQPPDFPEPGLEQGLESLLDDPLLGPLGPLF